MSKLLQIAGAVALAFPVATFAANSISFDPNGSAAGGAITIDQLDWSTGNAVAVGGAGVPNGGTTQLLYQANLFGSSLGGVAQTINGKFGSDFFTAVAGFSEVATVSNGGLQADFALTGVPASGLPSSTNFFYVYANQSAGGDNLAGTGFTAGSIILSGYVSAMNSSNFSITTVNNVPVITDFDKFNNNDFPTTQTLVGSGSTDLTVTITGFDSAYFPSLDFSSINFSFFNTSQVTPFQQADPSKLFDSDGLAGVPDFAPTLGLVNGFNGRGTGGVDFQFQADANQSFQTAVPEPGSLALVGLALAGVGFVGRRRNA